MSDTSGTVAGKPFALFEMRKRRRSQADLERRLAACRRLSDQLVEYAIEAMLRLDEIDREFAEDASGVADLQHADGDT